MPRISGLAWLAIVPLVFVGATTAASASPSSDAAAAMDVEAGQLVSSSQSADPLAAAVTTTPLYSFPRAGGSYLTLSTGLTSDLAGGTPEDFISTDLESAPEGADGNDLTSVTLELDPPATAECVAFDFQFLSEEYPEFVGSAYNDIFTAELNESDFTLDGSQVIAPNNFAYDTDGNFVSINTVLGFADATGTAMDGTTEPLVAVSPIETDISTGNLTLILTIQDLGDSAYDSAVLVDNLRWLYDDNCERSVSSLTDTDGDGLSDEWETTGIDYDGDGQVELNLPALGANPQRADVFIEVDWMTKPDTCFIIICWGGESFAPNPAALADVVSAFAAAPISNPNGTTGITLHIDAGPGSPNGAGTWGSNGGGGSIGWDEHLGTMSGSDYNWSEFDALKSSNFADVRADAFHYVVFADEYASSGSSGISRGIPASDFIVTDGHSSWGSGFSRIQERGTFMHEFGHNLSLLHGGPDSTTYQNDPQYQSIMNYLYQLVGIGSSNTLDYSRGAPYNDWENIRFDGGSVGDLGETAPLPPTTEENNELTPEIAKDADLFAIDGDAVLEFQGPNTIASARTGQTLTFEVSNVGSTSGSFVLAAKLPNGTQVGSTTVTVAGESTGSASIDIDATSIPVGPVTLTVTATSTSLGTVVDQVAAVLTAVNLNDPQTRTDLESDLEDLEALPSGQGPDQDALEAFTDLVETAGSAPIMERVSGNNRFETSAAVAAKFAPGDSDVVYVANGQNYPDALSAAPAAGFLGGPLLLTDRDALPSAIASQIVRLDPDRIVIVGGTAVVSPAVAQAIEALTSGTQVERVSGANRYETSRQISEDAFDAVNPADAFVATGTNFPDALSASAAAAYVGGPVILVPGGAASLDSDTEDTLDQLETTKAYIAGGSAVVSAGIQASLESKLGPTNVERLAGTDRYTTSVEINNEIISSADTVYLAVGTGFADALSGAALAGATDSPLFVVPGTCVPPAVVQAIEDLGANRVVLLGGTAVLSPAVFTLTPCA